MICNKIFFVVLIILCNVAFSCRDSVNKTGAKVITGKTKEKVNIKILRLDNDLFTVDIDSLSHALPGIRAKYGEIMELYSHKVIQLGSPSSPDFPEYLKRFVSDYYVNLFYNKVAQVYPSLGKVESDLSKAFNRYLEFFPEKHVPVVFSYISGGNFSVVTADTILGIGLDKYLGSDCEYYERMGLDKYKRYTMQSDYIVSDALRTWGYTEFEFNDSASNVLGNMLYEAKILYFIKQLMPEVEDSILLGFSPTQLKWCRSNEAIMWATLAEMKLLFSTDYLTIRKLVYPAPFTYYFTNESPGRATVWVGYQIVQSYMKRKSDVTLSELMAITDYSKMLRESGYKPKG